MYRCIPLGFICSHITHDSLYWLCANNELNFSTSIHLFFPNSIFVYNIINIYKTSFDNTNLCHIRLLGVCLWWFISTSIILSALGYPNVFSLYSSLKLCPPLFPLYPDGNFSSRKSACFIIIGSRILYSNIKRKTWQNRKQLKK